MRGYLRLRAAILGGVLLGKSWLAGLAGDGDDPAAAGPVGQQRTQAVRERAREIVRAVELKV